MLSPANSFNETSALAEWSKSHTGPLALPLALSTFGWVRLPDDADVFRGSPDPTAGPNSPHIEFEFFGIDPQNDLAGVGDSPPRVVVGQGGNNSLSTTIINLHPLSRECFKYHSAHFFLCNFG